jgi:hypothetical protein
MERSAGDASAWPAADLISPGATNAGAVLRTFDLLKVNCEDIRREPLEDRKRPRRPSCGSRTTASPSMSISAATARLPTCAADTPPPVWAEAAGSGGEAAE